MNLTDYYQILGVLNDATDEQIRLAYHKKIKLYHPDNHVADCHEVTKMAELINEAYTILGDAEKRLIYDAQYKEAFEKKEKVSAETHDLRPSDRTERKKSNLAGKGKNIANIFFVVAACICVIMCVRYFLPSEWVAFCQRFEVNFSRFLETFH